MKAARYNGWKNYQTWNIALWIGNDEGLYHMAREYAAEGYVSLAKALADEGTVKTADGVYYLDPALSIPELNRMMRELGE